MKPNREEGIRAGTEPVGWEGQKNRHQRLTQAERKVLSDLDTMIAMTARYRMIDTRHIITTATCRTKEVLSPLLWPQHPQPLGPQHIGSFSRGSYLQPACVPWVLQMWGSLGLGGMPRCQVVIVCCF